MTENEAIGQLKYMYKTCMNEKCKHKGQCDLCCESKDMVIQALEEIQQYRAIGTVKQFEWCKDASHWKELFKDKLEQYEAIGTVEDIQEVMALCKSLQDTTCKYMDIGTVEEFKALKEKNEPKKIKYSYYCGFTDTECPVCKNNIVYDKDKYCKNCGQKLDWQ